MRSLLLLTMLLAFLASACSSGLRPAAEPIAPGLALTANLPSGLVLTSDEIRGPLRRVTWESPTDRLEVRTTPVAGEGEAAALIADRARLLGSVFVQPYSPYKLYATSVRRCPDHLRPRPMALEQGGLRGEAYALSANSEYVYGGCSSESSVLTSIYANLYCPGGDHLFELRIFSPRKDGGRWLERTLASLRCAPG